MKKYIQSIIMGSILLIVIVLVCVIPSKSKSTLIVVLFSVIVSVSILCNAFAYDVAKISLFGKTKDYDAEPSSLKIISTKIGAWLFYVASIGMIFWAAF